MLPICQICLRTDRELKTIGDTITNFHDELCDFAIEDYVQLCNECMYLLKKFHEFKEKCLRATKILNNWKKQKPEVQKPLKLLGDHISSSVLSLCNPKNHKVYYYQHSQFNSIIENSLIQSEYTNDEENQNKILGRRHIFTVSTDQDGDTSNISANIDTVKDIKEEDCPNESECADTIIFTELSEKNNFDIDINLSENEDNGSIGTDYDIKDLVIDTDFKSDSDSSDTEIAKKRLRKTLAQVKLDMESAKKGKTVKRIRHKKPFDMESLRNMLRKIASRGEVKDSEGNVIDIDCIMNSLDKMHVYTLNQIKNRISGTSVLSTDAIEVLSRAQKKYGNQYSSVFTIEHLSTTEEIIAEFAKRQFYEGFVTSDHKCELCYRGFKHKKLLEYHVKVYHDANQPHSCAICQMRFKSRHALLKHRNGHRAVYKCKLCPLVTNYRTAMVNHYHQHKGVVYACEICKGIFKSKSCLSAHMNYMHQSQYICSLCARTFASEHGLSQHKIRKHENQPMPINADNRTCDQCNVTFATEEVYQRHQLKSHADKRTAPYVYKKRKYVNPRTKPNFVCRVCQITEHSIGRLTWHFEREHPTENFEQTYSDLRKYLCHICGKGYAKHSIGRLTWYFEREHPTENFEQTYSDLRKYLCHICGKGYASITDLNEHKHLHTGAKPYACDKCPKTFHRKINLRNHLERHLPPARECQQCGKKFVSSANLNNHMKMHIGIRHYTCEICSKSFLHRSALNAHVRGVHHHIRRARKHALKDNSII